jgi:hypothetical protein
VEVAGGFSHPAPAIRVKARSAAVRYRATLELTGQLLGRCPHRVFIGLLQGSRYPARPRRHSSQSVGSITETSPGETEAC